MPTRVCGGLVFENMNQQGKDYLIFILLSPVLKFCAAFCSGPMFIYFCLKTINSLRFRTESTKPNADTGRNVYGHIDSYFSALVTKTDHLKKHLSNSSVIN